MKLAAIVIAVSAAIAAAQDCDPTKLAPLVTSPNKSKCESDTGYKLLSLAPPSGDLAAKVCGNAACKALLGEVDAAFPTDCSAMGVKVRSGILEPTMKLCASAPAPGPAPTTPAATSVTPAATSSTPAATSKAPSTTPAASSATPAGTSKAPATTSKAPEPSTKAPAKNATSTGSHTGSHHSAPQEPEAGAASLGSAGGDIESPTEPTVTAPAPEPVAKPKPATPAPSSGTSTITVAAGALFAAAAASLL
ncbi:hypothetical protein P43SY_000499 [Pythium insidiosum]|uniref:Elicitin-like protein n=1 Tax=Pythium insidiosum TaxID=114742 RepID=A0AAD5LPN1_PYTIN|nr:hypothetical protein P43SY_000499 [Pythium insidiosum]